MQMSDAALLAGQKIIQELLRGAGDHRYGQTMALLVARVASEDQTSMA